MLHFSIISLSLSLPHFFFTPPYPTSHHSSLSAAPHTPGTRGFESEEKDRPQFKGDKEEPLRRSFVTNRKETYFPEFKRLNLRMLSFLSVFVITLLSSALIGVVFYLEFLVLYHHTSFQFRFFDWAVAALISVLIEVFSYLYMGFSTVLADNENHRTETEYEDSLITKTVFFKIFNHYGAVIFTIFFKGFLGELNITQYSTVEYSTVQYSTAQKEAV